MTLDNFSLFSLKRSADDSRNVILNSSFEHEQDGFPIYFCRSGFDFAKATTIPYEDFLATWTLDTADKHSGRQSLKIVFNESTRGQTLWAWGAGTVKDLPGVFSVWLKADREDFPVWLSYGKRQEVKVGTSWQRYEVVNPKLPGAGVYSPVTISFNKMHGTLWVDDLQAEFLGTPDGLAGLEGEGPLATPYRPSELDKQKFTTVKETPVRAPGFAVARLPDGLVPSGNLDTWRAKATRLSTTKTNRVRLKLARDGAALTDQTVPLEERNPVTMLGRLSYYMTEEEAVFKVSTTLAGAEGTTAVLTVAGQTVRAPAAPELRMCVPLEDIPYGTHPAALKLVKGDQTVAATSSQLVKRPYRQGATQVNEQHGTRDPEPLRRPGDGYPDAGRLPDEHREPNGRVCCPRRRRHVAGGGRRRQAVFLLPCLRQLPASPS
jgi:hypothetical protein